MISFDIPIKTDWRYGYRHGQRTWYGVRHRGIDLSCPKWTPIYAPASGTILNIKKSWKGGNELVIGHADDVVSYMCHIVDEGYRVGVREHVEPGQIIAYVGNTGALTTGAHLHWHIYIDGVVSDPALYFTNNNINMAVKNLADQQKKKLNDLLNGNVVVGYEVTTGKFYEIKDNKKEEFTEAELIRRHFMAAGNKATFDQIPNK